MKNFKWVAIFLYLYFTSNFINCRESGDNTPLGEQTDLLLDPNSSSSDPISSNQGVKYANQDDVLSGSAVANDDGDDGNESSSSSSVEDAPDKRQRTFIGKRQRTFIGKRQRTFIGKRQRTYIGKRPRSFIGKRNFSNDKRQRTFIGKRQRTFIGKRLQGYYDGSYDNHGHRQRLYLGKEPLKNPSRDEYFDLKEFLLLDPEDFRNIKKYLFENGEIRKDLEPILYYSEKLKDDKCKNSAPCESDQNFEYPDSENPRNDNEGPIDQDVRFGKIEEKKQRVYIG